MNKKIVVALGGNALGKTPEEQKEIVKVTAKSIVDLVKEGYKVISDVDSIISPNQARKECFVYISWDEDSINEMSKILHP